MARPKKGCVRHHGIGHFSRIVPGGSARLWTCSICGVEKPWTETWSYFGMISCRWCGCEPAIEVVTCSDACRDAANTPGVERATASA
jgi:hypothetical protein